MTSTTTHPTRFAPVPRLWPGATIAVLASGPSMSADVAAAVRRAGVRSIAVNTTVQLAPWADVLYAADADWWNHPSNADVLRAYSGLRYSVSQVPGVRQLRNSGVAGFDPDPTALRSGGNSAYQAVHLAVHLGAARILLCGLDMQPQPGACHWHGPHPYGLRETGPALFERWRQRFATLAPELERLGVDVVNVTPGSALTCFRRSTLETELCREPATC
jgi:sugar phosphate isomerase/epimerase